MSSFNFLIDLPVQSEWKNVDLLRTSVQNCFIAVFSDVDGCHAIAMVTGELVENAVKYGDWSSRRSFRLRVTGDPGRATVAVENPVRRDDPGVTELRRILDWIRGFPSAADAYRARLMEIAAQPAEGASKLGLVRVAYEGNCALSVQEDGGTLRVTAEMTF